MNQTNYWILKFINPAGQGMWFVEYDTKSGDCSLIEDEYMARRFLTFGAAERLLQKLKEGYPDAWGPGSVYKIFIESRELQ